MKFFGTVLLALLPLAAAPAADPGSGLDPSVLMHPTNGLLADIQRRLLGPAFQQPD